MLILVISYSFDGTHTGTQASPFSESCVFSRPYEVHPAFVVGLFKEEPASADHLAGEYVVCLEHVHDIWTVIHKSHHLTSILHSLKQFHLMRRSLRLIESRTKRVKISYYLNTKILSHFSLIPDTQAYSIINIA